MGQEIQQATFTDEDFAHYEQCLREETTLLGRWFDKRGFVDEPAVGGCELEVWLVDEDGEPAPVNVACLEALEPSRAAPELAQFNIELNSVPQTLQGDALSRLYADLQLGWQELRQCAQANGADAVAIGILPTVRDEHLTMQYMSPMNRYRALNEQLLKHRHGKPMQLDIVGHEHLKVTHCDVMLESVTTSFQIHYQVPQDLACRVFNASMILSAPLVALSANSPYLFGHDLWEETRIPVFEQAITAGGFHHAADGPLKRVTFGHDYVHESLFEAFEENLEHYPVLLPFAFQSRAAALDHLRLHNGTIWRWNRPLIGFDEWGKPHLRVEQRVTPAGPTLADMVANMAFYFGLVHTLSTQDAPPEQQLDFALARDNFYQAARHGLHTHVQWLDGETVELKRLILDSLLEQAWFGLEALGISSDDIHRWLGIVEQRVISEQTGSRWQRRYIETHGRDMRAMLAAYQQRQMTETPVHEWDL